MTRRWVNRPPGSNWGEFGDDDQLGRLNLLTPARVRRAAAEIVAGVSFCLSLPLDYPGASRLNPTRHPPRLRPTVREGRPARNFRVGEVVEGAVDEGKSALIVPLLLSYGGIETGIRRRLEGLPYRMAGQALLPDERLSDWVLLQVDER